jgi:hypothetical protein
MERRESEDTGKGGDMMRLKLFLAELNSIKISEVKTMIRTHSPQWCVSMYE